MPIPRTTYFRSRPRVSGLVRVLWGKSLERVLRFRAGVYVCGLPGNGRAAAVAVATQRRAAVTVENSMVTDSV